MHEEGGERQKSDTAADGVINTTDDHRRLSAFFLLSLFMMTNLQMRSLSGYDRSGGKSGPRAASRLESSQSPEAIESLKALRASGQTEISAIEAAKILGGSRQRFSKMVTSGKVKGGGEKLMTLDSLISWVAKGVAQSASRQRYGIGSELDWLREG